MKKFLLSGIAVLSAAVSTSANATIIDISAADDVGVELSLASGTYLIRWVGIADGGLYDAASGVSVTPGGPVGFSNAFTVQGPGFPTFDFDIFTKGVVYGNAADSLAAYKAGTGINHISGEITGGVFSLDSVSPLSNPWIVDLTSSDTGRLRVFDTDGTRTNNTGGVSLSFELVRSAVPEPQTWMMMIAGFGLVGATMRRRQQVHVSYA